MYSQRQRDKIKTGLDHCANGNGCAYECDTECPYSITAASCDRSQLLMDALKAINELEKDLDAQYKRLDNVRDAVCGPLDDECCSYECEVPTGDGYKPEVQDAETN